MLKFIYMIRTVLGDRDSIGYTQCHEHLFIEKSRSFDINPDLFMDDLALSASELSEYYSSGGRCVVDCQPVYCGRMAELLYSASRQSGVDILASTGFHKTCFYPDDAYFYSMSERKIAELYISEIECGMISSGGQNFIRTDIKAGIIKTAVDSGGVSGIYEKLFEAALAAQSQTGAPIILHTDPGTDPISVLKKLKDLGAGVLIFCHLDRTCGDLGVHSEIASEAFLEYDTIARPKYHDDEKEIEIIKSLIKTGYEDRLLIGLDTTRARLKSYGGAPGLDYILKNFKYKLKTADVSDDAFRKITIDNPNTALSIALSIAK